MLQDYEYMKSERRGKHRHHHHHKSRSSSKKSSTAIQLSLDSEDDAGQAIANWRHEAHVKDHEIKILRRMVENAKTEIQRKEQTVAKMVERIPAFQNENKGLSKEALEMIETLERKLSERVYQTLKIQQDLESAQAGVTERNERIHDLCLQWEKSTQLLKEARERDLAELHKQIRHLEDEVIPALRARAEAAEAREKQLRNELTVAQARIKQIEAMAQEKLAQKERQLSEATRRIRELELDLEHVMAAAARYTRREVLVEHLGGQLQNTMGGAYEARSAAQTPYTPVGNIYQQIGTAPSYAAPQSAQPMTSQSYASEAPRSVQPTGPSSSAQQQMGYDPMASSVPGTSSAPTPVPYGQSPAPPAPPPPAAPPMPTPRTAAPPVAPPPQAPMAPPVPPAPQSVPMSPPPRAPPPPPKMAPVSPPKKVSFSEELKRSLPKPPMSQSKPEPPQASTSSYSPVDESPRPPPLPGQQQPMMPPMMSSMQQQGAPVPEDGQRRFKYSFQEHIPENSPRHRLSVIMRKLKDPTVLNMKNSLNSQVKA